MQTIVILHFITSLKRGGRERQLAAIVKSSAQDHYPSKIIYLNERTPNYIDEYSLTEKLLKIQSGGFAARLFELNKILRKEQPHIVFTWGNLESIFVLLLKPFYKFKFINGSIRHGTRSKFFWHNLRLVILHLSRYIVANSHAGLRANKLKRGYVLYNGVDGKFIGMLSHSEKIERRKALLNYHAHSPVFISVANLIPYKDYFSVLEALMRIKSEGHDFLYLILGDGPLRNAIENKIIEYGLTNNVRILGHVENVYDYLKTADIFIHSSKGEGCSNAILEAMFTGLPIIASNTGGTSELVFKKSFRLFEYKNCHQLADILLNVENEFKDFDSKSKEYKDHLKKFTIETMINNFEKILTSILNDE